MSTTITEQALDAILSLQLTVAWAGEGRCKPKRFGWWDTDLIDENGGGDFLSQLAPRTHAWAALALAREAARRVDAKARSRHGDGDELRSLYFLGFELDEKLDDRLAALKRSGLAPSAALSLPFALGAEWPAEKVAEVLSGQAKVSFEKVPPVGRELAGTVPAAPEALVKALTAALVPIAPEYPLPFFRLVAGRAR